MLAWLFACVVIVAMSGPPNPAAPATPTPTPYKPLAVPTPAATPWGPLTLGGVTIADTPGDVRARFGEPFSINAKPEETVWTYPFDANHVLMNVFMRRGRVSSVSISLSGGAKQSLFADPFNVHLGDGIDLLLSTRGQPTKQVENRNVYAAGPGFDWEYQFDHGIAASIVLNTSVAINGPLPDPMPGPPGHDASSADKVIKFKGVTGAAALLTEYVYLAQFCDGKGTWTLTDHAVIKSGGQNMDVQSLTCSTTQRAVRWYFAR